MRLPTKYTPTSPTEIEKAWLAGLLEGEGTFLRKGQYSIAIALRMTDKDVVQRAAQIMGVTRLTIEDRKNPRWKTCYAVALTGARAVDVLGWIVPYMGERRAARIRELLARYRPYAPAPKVHGTKTMYDKAGCRCRPCTDAAVDVVRQSRIRKRIISGCPSGKGGDC